MPTGPANGTGLQPYPAGDRHVEAVGAKALHIDRRSCDKSDAAFEVDNRQHLLIRGHMFNHMHVILLISAVLLPLPVNGQEPSAAAARPLPGSARFRPTPVVQDCGLREVNAPTAADRPAAGAISEVPQCSPPYETPSYTKPTDDSVALGALLEASGFPGAQGASWVGVAAGNFCGTAQRQLVVASSLTSEFSLLEGQAPYLIGNVAEYPEADSRRPPAGGESREENSALTLPQTLWSPLVAS